MADAFGEDVAPAEKTDDGFALTARPKPAARPQAPIPRRSRPKRVGGEGSPPEAPPLATQLPQSRDHDRRGANADGEEVASPGGRAARKAWRAGCASR